MAKKAKKDKSEKVDKLVEIRERVRLAMEADEENRTRAMEDLKFVNQPGWQWETQVKNERGDRPCLEFNKLRVTIKRVVNDMRANRPSGKVRGVEEADKQTAEVYEGLIRNIWNVSDGDTVIDAAAEYQVSAGIGAWRVTVDYESEDSFDQEIRIEGIRNPFQLYADPACHDPLKRDARYWVLVSRISKTAFEEKYPDAEVVGYEHDTQFDDSDEWEDEESIRIVEYWYRERYKRAVLLLEDGRTIYEDDPEYAALEPKPAILKQRDVMANRIKMCIASGNAIVEEAEWVGSQFPFVLVHGEQFVIDGDNIWFGLTRFAKDAQRAYNYSRTLATETVALAPQAKWWATPTQAKGHVEKWAEAHKKNYPFLLYTPDSAAQGPPQRMGGADIPAAWIQEMNLASEDIRGTTGVFEASLGQPSNEKSGIAIQARQQQGEIAVFNYMDNLSKGIRRTWEILIDLIPKIYDTPRAVRILGADGAEKYEVVNQGMQNDLSRGKYDVTITVGPSFSTQRQQASEIYGQMVQRDPQMQAIAGDLIFKAMDLPYSDQIAERYKLMLPPQIQQAEAQGKKIPPEAMQVMAQAEQAMQMVQQHGQLVQQAAAELEQKSAEVEKARADLAAQEAQFKALVAQEMAKISTAQAKLTQSEAQLIVKQADAGADERGAAIAQDREALATQIQQGLAAIQQQAADFAVQAVGAIQQIQQAAQPHVVVADPPKRKVVRSKKIGNEWISEVQEVA